MEYKHFSHQHNLTLSRVQQGQRHLCHGCQTWCSGDSIYACWRCNFFLHEHCGNANRFLKHPAHKQHPLILLPNPTYCSGAYICNACNSAGNSFSYSCALCEIDLHVNCAFLPLKVTHKIHQHDLYLSVPTDQNQKQGTPEFCKICTKELDSKVWFFCCTESECDFRVHTFCATSEVKPGHYTDDGPETETTSAAAKTPATEVPVPVPNGSTQTGFTMEQLVELEQMKLQMQMAEQLAQMMGSFNLSHLV